LELVGQHLCAAQCSFLDESARDCTISMSSDCKLPVDVPDGTRLLEIGVCGPRLVLATVGGVRLSALASYTSLRWIAP
jgi:hypothetical protein